MKNMNGGREPGTLSTTNWLQVSQNLNLRTQPLPTPHYVSDKTGISTLESTPLPTLSSYVTGTTTSQIATRQTLS